MEVEGTARDEAMAWFSTPAYMCISTMSPSCTGWSRPTCWPLNCPAPPPELRVLERSREVLVNQTRHIVNGAARAHRERGAHVRRTAWGLGVDAGDLEPLEQEPSDRIEAGAGLDRRCDAWQIGAAELAERGDFAVRILEKIGLGRDRQGRQPNRERIVVFGLRVGRLQRLVPVREQRDSPFAEKRPSLLGAFEARGLGEIDDEQRRVRGLQGVHDPGNRMVAGDRRQIHELEVDVLERQHRRLGEPSGEGVGADLGVCTGELGDKSGFSGVRGSEHRNLCGTLRSNDERRSGAGTAPLRTRELLGELLDPRLDVALEMLGALVLGDGAQHLPQALEPFLGLARAAEGGSAALYSGERLAGIAWPSYPGSFVAVRMLTAGPAPARTQPRCAPAWRACRCA